MRFVDRRIIPTPMVLRSVEADSYRSEVTRYLAQDASLRRPPKAPSFLLDSSEVRHALRRLFQNICAYCETPLGDEGEIDHFRPAQGAENTDGSVDYRHYCWLALEWDNIYLACPACMRAKRNLFPVDHRGIVGGSITDLRRTEGHTLLDPCRDYAVDHLKITTNGILQPISRRGEISIHVLNLNRPELIERRGESVRRFLRNTQIPSFHARVEDFLPPMPFTGSLWLAVLDQLPPRLARRNRRPRRLTAQRLRRLLATLRDTGPIGPDGGFPRPIEDDGRRYIRRVVVRNFRGIPDATLEFPSRGKEQAKAAGSLIVLGDNGTGKTTLLQAAALGALGPAKAMEADITPDWCLADGANDGEVRVEFWDTKRANRVHFERGSTLFTGEEQVPVMVLGYGAYRLPARSTLGEDRRGYDYRVHSLFSERDLINGALGLRQHLKDGTGKVDKRRLQDATRTLNAVLLGRAEARLDRDHRMIVDDRGRPQTLDELSSGYKSIVAITADVMDVMYEVWDGLTSGQAMILIDEIDAHLHPSWRLLVVEALRQAFPMSQFLMTTHDPLPLRGLADSEIVVLNRDDRDVSIGKPRVHGLNGLTVDQMLTSDLFGLSSTLDPTIAADLARYYTLLRVPKPSATERAELLAAEARLPPQVPIGDTLRERLVYRVVDRYLAQHERRGLDWSDETIDQLVNEFLAAEREAIESDEDMLP